MRCKAICRNFDRECEFLQGAFNGAAFNMALLFQNRYANFQRNKYHLDSLLIDEIFRKGRQKRIRTPR